jgi:hypothetical protein
MVAVLAVALLGFGQQFAQGQSLKVLRYSIEERRVGGDDRQFEVRFTDIQVRQDFLDATLGEMTEKGLPAIGTNKWGIVLQYRTDDMDLCNVFADAEKVAGIVLRHYSKNTPIRLDQAAVFIGRYTYLAESCSQLMAQSGPLVPQAP